MCRRRASELNSIARIGGRRDTTCKTQKRKKETRDKSHTHTYIYIDFASIHKSTAKIDPNYESLIPGERKHVSTMVAEKIAETAKKAAKAAAEHATAAAKKHKDKNKIRPSS
ncbi:hypothetical protein BUALT_Bualt08G0112100 [Buddleja alternifolia]|uniref:Uncharacterized protein n=1 Tax=Buddleja alternifolia TaxID=168488 RepID=A0AAV6XGB4_9LAMI|nr:hypothetical protein BUALT_Bualt08G0112100 [Buddleja alternifolia]